MSHAPSVASGVSVASTSTAITTPAYVAHVKPPPEYISQSSASQLANDVADAYADQDESWRRTGRAAVAEGAVGIVNAFLDRQLYEFINVAKTTGLVALKPAVTEVLKKNLAKDAIASAQSNLEDLLAVQDSEREEEVRPSSQTSARWNLEFTWKRSRLRVMMRSEKSDFDIDDDERYVHEESLSTSFSETAGVISLASEIFLAGILDYLADLLLALATQAAIARTRRRGSNATASPNPNEQTHILVQDADVEKAALNSALDRLWRGWRKSLRSLARTSQSIHSAANSPVVPRRGSLFDRFPDRPENHYPEHVLASNIPLPTGPRDVDEIEVPGLATDPDAPTKPSANPKPNRPQSNGYFAHKSAQAADKSRPFSVPAPIVTPFVDAPGAWPGATPAVETDAAPPHVDSSTARQDGRPASKDSAHSESESGDRASVSSQPTSLDDRVPSLRSVQRPKRLAIYGSSSTRFTQANISREGLDSIQDQDRPFSPEDFLASRNLGASSNNVTPTSDSQRSRGSDPAAESDTVDDDVNAHSSDESETEAAAVGTAVSPPGFDKASLPSPLARAFPGLGLSRTQSDASRRTPVSEQRVSVELIKKRRTSKLTDSDPNSPGKRGSLRQISSSSTRDSLDERKKFPLSASSLEADFDLLLQSEETVKYTLTPDSVRDVPDRAYSPHMRLQREKTLFRSGSGDNLSKKQDSDAQSVRSIRSTTWSIGGSKDKKESAQPEAKRKASITRPNTQNTSALPSGYVAREPVMQTESTRDFADFIRSTGPDKEPNPVVPTLASRSISSLRATATAQAAAANNAPPVPPPSRGSLTGKYIPRSPLGPLPKRSPNRPSLMAREASGSSDNNNDLIDFIRSGPPGSGGKARVPNHIAPFADFDDDDGLDMATTITGASELPRTSVSTYRPVTASTTNSRTGLLPNVSGSYYNSSSLTPTLPTQFSAPSPKPPAPLNVPNARAPIANDTQRKRTRIKDPYAIPDDSDEDEEDELGALPGDAPADSTQPPPGPGDSAQTRAGAEKPRAGSVGSLHSSAGRSPSVGGGKIPSLTGNSPNPGYAPSISSVRSATSTTAVRPAHITSSVTSGGAIPRSGKPKMEVRAAGTSKARLDPFHSTGTSDLADFLKSSGPPEPPARRNVDSAPAPTVGGRGAKPEKTEKKKTKFWQRSSSSKATYLDLP